MSGQAVPAPEIPQVDRAALKEVINTLRDSLGQVIFALEVLERMADKP